VPLPRPAIVSGTASGDYLSGGAGNDSISAAAANSAWLDGGGGNDTLIGSAADDVLAVGAGNSSLTGNGGHDLYVTSDAGNDTIIDNSSGIAVNSTNYNTTTTKGLNYNAATGIGGWAGTGAWSVQKDTLVLGPGIGFGDITMQRVADTSGGDDLLSRALTHASPLSARATL
jgi:Ca2+-binding RTX toxin-like protein